MKLPKRPAAHILETESVKILNNDLPSRWIVREMTERDYGVDLYVEVIGEDNLLSGNLVALQLKGRKQLIFKGGVGVICGVKRSTLNYWNRLPVPVFIVVTCAKVRRSYWANIKELYRTGKISGTDERIRIPVEQWCDFGKRGTLAFILSTVREDRWPETQRAIVDSIMLYQSLGPLVLHCVRQPDAKLSSQTVHHAISEHYDRCAHLLRYFLDSPHLLKPYKFWLEKNIAYAVENNCYPSLRLYHSVMKEMIRSFCFHYIDAIRVCREEVTGPLRSYFEKYNPIITQLIKESEAIGYADEWVATYFFDEHENENTEIEQVYFRS